MLFSVFVGYYCGRLATKQVSVDPAKTTSLVVVEQELVGPYNMHFVFTRKDIKHLIVVANTLDTELLTYSSVHRKPVRLVGYKGWAGNRPVLFVVNVERDEYGY